MAEDKLARLLEAYRKMQAEERKRCEKIDMQVADLQAKRITIMGELQEKMDQVKRAIEREALRFGQMYVHPVFGKVGYRNGYIRVNWDAKALDALETENPKVWKLIKQYRGETEVGPSVKVE